MTFITFAERYGMEKGRETGALVGKIHAFQVILKQPLTPEKDLYAMTDHDLAALVEQLRKQALSNGNGARP